MQTLKQNLVLIFIVMGIMISGCSSQKMIPDFSGVKDFPFNAAPPAGITNPVLTAADVTDRNVEGGGVGDPFLFFEDGKWYMFFEIVAAKMADAEIALATSSDGLHWNYDRVVLSLGYHQTWPYVIKYGGKYYMIPETYTEKKVQVYEAKNFPYDWKYVSTIASGKAFVDPTVFRYNDTWWMFVGSENSNCHLYYSDNLTSGWVEHPESPIVSNDMSKARPGGPSFVFGDNRIVRLTQKCDLMYGEKVRAFEVDLLTKTSYHEHEMPESPILEPDGRGWNSVGMHQFTPWWTGEKWIIAVDGIRGGRDYSIGIYMAEGEAK
jgi:hypothetical protein